MLGNAGGTFSQAHVHWLTLKSRAGQNWREGRLMLATISVFMVLYMTVAYFLVNKGLQFVVRLPLIGPVLTERMLYLLFFFFFVMLILSNAAITGISLFRRQETGWLLSLPLPHQSLVMWKTIEGLLLSSWGLLLLSAPIMAGFGQALGAGLMFYAVSIAALLCLIAIASNVSSWLLLVVIRFYRPWWIKVAAVVLVVLMGLILWQIRDAQSARLVSGDVAANVNQILKHTEICTHPLLPSSWVAEALIAASRDFGGRAVFYVLTLLSYAMVVWSVTSWLAGRVFYSTWNKVFRRSLEKRSDLKRSLPGARPKRHIIAALLNLFRPSRSTRALLTKDGITFLREPMQWGQCALIFGLLLLYTSNLRHMGYNYKDPLWSSIISFLNLTVCSLAMSTLTTRFVFPQFSMEGQRLWILGLAPFPLSKVLNQKLLMNLAAATPLTALLVLISGLSLALPWHRMAFFVAAIILLTSGLNIMALSLGVLLPNYRETNSAKIVSGFGGTLCLVLSFFYIVIGVGISTVPTILERRAPAGKLPLSEIYQYEALAIVALFIITILSAGLPYFFAFKRTKKLANLGNP